MPQQSLRGFVGQSLGGRKSSPDGLPALLSWTQVSNGTTATVTATQRCVALIYAIGGGGSPGAFDLASSGSAGGDAAYKRLRMAKGQILLLNPATPCAGNTNSDGNDGNPSLVTMPNGIILSAAGGQRGRKDNGTTAAGGIGGALATPSGWDIYRFGGSGGSETGGVGSAGSSGGTGGGAAGAAGANYGGGGGAAGFGDISVFMKGADGTQGGAVIQGQAPGAGTGGAPTSGAGLTGSPGTIWVFFVRVT